MLLLKVPGVTGSKIASITALCNENIQVRLKLVVILMLPSTAFQSKSLMLCRISLVRVGLDSKGVHPLQESARHS